MRAMEIQSSHLRGYKNCISQTSSFTAQERRVSTVLSYFIHEKI